MPLTDPRPIVARKRGRENAVPGRYGRQEAVPLPDVPERRVSGRFGHHRKRGRM